MDQNFVLWKSLPWSFQLMTVLVMMGTPLAAAEPSPVKFTQDDSKQFYFPTSDQQWKTISPQDAGWDAAKIELALKFARERKSSGVVILYRGRIMAEKYWELYPKPRLNNGLRNRYYSMQKGKNKQGRALEDVASAQKSVAAILVGIAQEKGLLKIDDAVSKHLGEGWSKATREQEARITIRHLLSMTSGLSARLTYEADAGTKWKYNSSAYAKSLVVVAAASKMDHNEFTAKWLTGPIGMRDSTWVKRPWASLLPASNQYGFVTTARDLSRFGLMVLAKGQWGGKGFVNDKEYLNEAVHPSQQMNPSYGFLWWLNGQSHRLTPAGSRKIAKPMNSNAPADMLAAKGALGRKVYVVPSLDLVVVRLGDNPNVAGAANFDDRFWQLLMKAAPKDGR